MSLKDFQVKIGAAPDGVFGKQTIQKAMDFYKISKEQAAHFFGQCAVESVEFTKSSENLNYTKAERIVQVFRSDIDMNNDRQINAVELAKAKSLTRNPIGLANFVYANQNGNGNEASGDGYKFRGRGALQLTGRANYQAFADFIKDSLVMSDPDLVATKYYIDSAMFFFAKNKLWSLATKVDDSTITRISKRVNGGTNGLKERLALTKKYYSWFTN
jgi:putative chitinase